jgi:hypothetical protein
MQNFHRVHVVNLLDVYTYSGIREQMGSSLRPSAIPEDSAPVQ